MYKIKKLKNNLTLITVPLKSTRATTVMVMVPVGSRYESRDFSGGSHFVEHLIFKGTSKRPTAQDVSRVLDAAGADYNAFTGKDYTGYYVKIDSEKQELAFDLVSDMLFNSKFDASEIEKEKGVIVEELRMYEDNPTMSVDTLFEKLCFGDCALGWDIGGTPDSVRSVSREQLWNYFQSAYKVDNMVLVVAGNISKNLNKYLGYFLQDDKTKNNKRTIRKNDFKKFSWTKNNLSISERVSVKEKKLDQSHIIIGFPGLSLNHKDRYALSVLLNILGGGMSSRLFEEVRERRGLAYMVRAGSSSYRDVGLAYIQAGLDPARLPEAIKVIRLELNKISENEVSKKELSDAKSNFSGRLTLNMEDSSALAEWFAKQFWFNDSILTYEQVLKNINKVTLKDVQRVAKKVFDWDQVRVALIGSVKKDSLIKMLK